MFAVELPSPHAFHVETRHSRRTQASYLQSMFMNFVEQNYSYQKPIVPIKEDTKERVQPSPKTQAVRGHVNRAFAILLVIEQAESERTRRLSFDDDKRQYLAAKVSNMLKIQQHEDLHRHVACHHKTTKADKNVCKFFLRGRCKKGAQCRFNHPYLHLCPWCGNELGNKVTSHLRACAALAKKNGMKA